jgi:hypothetical protein
VVIIQQKKLAAFGYILDTEVEKQTESFYILRYLKEIIITILGFGEINLTNLGHFFHEKFFVYAGIIFFKSKFGEK